ncbi:dephospho-CoA kinase [Gordonia rubripertincta]|uniref:Dephospho-CoA kinase n=1 Tax=Gordonia rubripertincta TaxID=36822 RepID=A0ABT4MQI3_GORRU|nr:dephospho-CoA kinase [Gordonia rubripertincta]MCZ4549260.1 dephospho-CoA kinase [Gordonia rubripertincta]
MIRVGLTGGIGAGKSTVARTLTERGAYLIDADVIAREVVAPGTEGLAQLVAAFGEDILQSDGALDRAALAAKAFVDDEQRKKLNGITHPLVGARAFELLEAAPADAIVLQDIPLLVENGSAPFFHLVVIVHADEDVRLERLTGQRGMPEDDARARIKSQASVEDRRAVADVWLDNSGTPDDLAALAAALWDERLVPYEGNLRNRICAPQSSEEVEPRPEWTVQATRLTNRLRVIGGDKIADVVHIGPTAASAGPAPDVLDFEVRLADGKTPADVAELLADGGFPQRSVGVHANADPGRAVSITLK